MGDDEASATVLAPGVVIRPQTSIDDVVELAERLYGLVDVQVREHNSYDDRNYHIKVTEGKQAEGSWPHGYIMKIINSLDTKKLSFFDAQTKMMVHLGENGITCPQPVRNVNGDYFSVEKFHAKEDGAGADVEHLVRLLTFQPGTILHQVTCTDRIFYQAGRYVAQLDQVLKTFNHPVFATHKSLWFLEAVPTDLRKFQFAVTCPERSALVTRALDEFDALVVPAMEYLERGVIHGDFNEQNILVRPSQEPGQDGEWEIHAIIDFGDSQKSCLLFELAISMCYLMLQRREADGDPLDVAGHVLAGYSTVRKLPVEELALLKTCIAGRLCQSLVMGAYSHIHDPNNAYLMTTQATGWNLLAKIDAVPREKLTQHWVDISRSYEKV